MRFDPRRHALGMALTALYGAAFLWPFRGFFPRFSTHLIADHGDTLLLLDTAGDFLRYLEHAK